MYGLYKVNLICRPRGVGVEEKSGGRRDVSLGAPSFYDLTTLGLRRNVAGDRGRRPHVAGWEAATYGDKPTGSWAPIEAASA
jgi:hypothetical protein